MQLRETKPKRYGNGCAKPQQETNSTNSTEVPHSVPNKWTEWLQHRAGMCVLYRGANNKTQARASKYFHSIFNVTVAKLEWIFTHTLPYSRTDKRESCARFSQKTTEQFANECMNSLTQSQAPKDPRVGIKITPQTSMHHRRRKLPSLHNKWQSRSITAHWQHEHPHSSKRIRAFRAMPLTPDAHANQHVKNQGNITTQLQDSNQPQQFGNNTARKRPVQKHGQNSWDEEGVSLRLLIFAVISNNNYCSRALQTWAGSLQTSQHSTVQEKVLIWGTPLRIHEQTIFRLANQSDPIFIRVVLFRPSLTSTPEEQNIATQSKIHQARNERSEAKSGARFGGYAPHQFQNCAAAQWCCGTEVQNTNLNVTVWILGNQATCHDASHTIQLAMQNLRKLQNLCHPCVRFCAYFPYMQA